MMGNARSRARIALESRSHRARTRTPEATARGGFSAAVFYPWSHARALGLLAALDHELLDVQQVAGPAQHLA